MEVLTKHKREVESVKGLQDKEVQMMQVTYLTKGTHLKLKLFLLLVTNWWAAPNIAVTEIFSVLFLFERANSSEMGEHSSALLTGRWFSQWTSAVQNIHAGCARQVTSDPTMPKTILKVGLETVFPNLYVALQMFLTIPVTNCVGERSNTSFLNYGE